MEYPKINLTQMQRIIKTSVLTRRPAMFLGSPGIGKTEVAGQVARELGLSLAYLELGLTVPEEIGGVPVRTPGQAGSLGGLVRLPLGPIAQACSQPTLLVIDEVTRADPMRQGAAMTGVNERRWGDYKLHEQSAVILAGNLPESGGTFTILDALLNRCGVYRTVTTRELVRAYLETVGAPGSNLAATCQAWAMFSESRPELIEPEPPPGFAESGQLWASPRAVHHACQRYAANLDLGMDPDDETGLAEMAGVVGNVAAVAFMTVKRLQNKLPTAKEIAANFNAKLPPDSESAIAVGPIVKEAGALNPDNAWLYAERFRKENKDQARVLCVQLFKAGKIMPKTPNGMMAMQRIIGEMGLQLQKARDT